MPGRTSEIASRPLAALLDGASVAGLTDAELLGRFVGGHGRRAEVAFEALVDRHGPMVRGVCRRLLGDAADADDAFQATFLVLVRRAGAVRVGDSLGPWLFGGARMVAGRVRADRERRRRRERPGDPPDRVASAGPGLPPADLLAALDGEVARLAEPFRAAVVLCDLGGRTHEQAAADLGCPVGTVKSRLARGRARLKARLGHRVADWSGALPVLGPLGVPPRLVGTTARLAMAAVGPGSRAASLGPIGWSTLTDGVARMMILQPMKWLAGGALVVATAAAGWTHGGGRGNDDTPRAMLAVDTPRPAEPESASRKRCRELAVRILGPDHWAAQPNVGLIRHDASRGSYIYAQTYELQDDSMRMVVGPFAMIAVSRGGSSHKTVTADQSRLEFSQPFGSMKAPDKPQRVVHAKLAGNVRIRDDKGTPEDPKDDMLIGPLTAVEFDEKALDELRDPAPSPDAATPRADAGRDVPSSPGAITKDDPAQSPPPETATGTTERKPPSIAEYVIAPPDVLFVAAVGDVQLLKERPISGDRLVRPDGKISLGYYGEVQVGDLSITEARTTIKAHLEGLSPGLGLHGPFEVQVAVSQANSKVYYVQGEVRSPGRYPAKGNETVLDAIAQAGGLIQSGRPLDIRLVRQALRRTGVTTYTLAVNLSAIVDRGDSTTNYPILPGDRLVVSHASLPLDGRASASSVSLAEKAGASDRPPVSAAADVPREFGMVALPEYVVQPPDMIVVEVLEALPGRPISGERLVRPDGKINLGFYGEVSVAGLTTTQLKEKVVLHLRTLVDDEKLGLTREVGGQPITIPPGQTNRVFIDIAAYNSQFYYTQGNVLPVDRYHITGRETVLDAFSLGGKAVTDPGRVDVRLVRPAAPGAAGGPRVLPVDLAAIIERGDAATNYQLMPGDRLIANRPAGGAPPGPAPTVADQSARIDELERKLEAALRKLEERGKR